MSKLKRNMIKLVKNPKEAAEGGEIEFETYWTSPFIPIETTYEAMDIAQELENEDSELSFREEMDMITAFVVNKLYNKQFTEKKLKESFHGPDFIAGMRDQIFFISQGQQSDETKKFLANKN